MNNLNELQDAYTSRVNQLAFVGSELLASDLVAEANVIAETMYYLVFSSEYSDYSQCEFISDFYRDLYSRCYADWSVSATRSIVPEPTNYNQVIFGSRND